jgi:hypothetical protein
LGIGHVTKRIALMEPRLQVSKVPNVM